jgi:hypothetical protein
LIADLARWVLRVKALACTILCEAVEICLGCYHGADFPIFLLVLSVGIVGGGRSFGFDVVLSVGKLLPGF